MVLIIFLSITESWSDTFYTSPIDTYILAGGYPRGRTLSEIIDNSNAAFQRSFDHCMADNADRPPYDEWFCTKWTYSANGAHPVLNTGYVNGIPRVYEINSVQFIYQKFWDHVETYSVPAGDTDADVKWDCPTGFQQVNIDEGNDSITMVCKKIEEICPIDPVAEYDRNQGNPIDIRTCKKNEYANDYAVANSNLSIDRVYLDQENGWIVNDEPRVLHLQSGESASSAGFFNGLGAEACPDPYSQYLIHYTLNDPEFALARESYYVNRCPIYTGGLTEQSTIYLWRNGKTRRFIQQGEVFFPEGGFDKDTWIEAANEANLPDAVWMLKRKSGVIEYFNADGNITRRLSSSGTWVDFNYQGSRLISKSDHTGRSIHFNYNESSGRLESALLPNGELISYFYKNNDDSETRTYWLIDHVTWPDGESVAYAYNEPEHITGTGNDLYLTGKYDSYQNRIGTYKYEYGKAKSTEKFGGTEKRIITQSSTQSTVEDGRGRKQYYYFYSSLSNGTKLLTRYKDSSIAANRSKFFTYNTDGRLTEERGFNSNKIQYAYDPTHKLRTVTVKGIPYYRYGSFTGEGANLPAGASKTTTQWDTTLRKPLTIASPRLFTHYIYDGNPDPFNNDQPANCRLQNSNTAFPLLCRVVKQATTDSSGALGLNAQPDANVPLRDTKFTYNEQGRLLTITRSPATTPEYTVNYYLTQGANHKQGDIQSVTNALNQTTWYLAYDDLGNPTEIQDANGTVAMQEYDTRGRLISRTVEGHTTSMSYDLNGRLQSMTQPDGTTLTYEYDGAGNLVALIDEDNNRTEYSYDLEGNQLSQKILDAAATLTFNLQKEYDAVYRLQKVVDSFSAETEYAYDKHDNITTTTNPNLHATAQAYDIHNRLIKTTDPLNGITKYAYDEQNNLVSVTDPNGLATSYTYNAFGNMLTQSSPDTGITTYTYDEAGNRISKTDARGVVTTYGYDALNRLTTIQFPDESLDITFVYDQGVHGIGHLTQMTDSQGTTDYTYDDFGNLVNQTRTTNDNITTTFVYHYDNLGRLIRLTYPSGNQIQYSYNNLGQIVSLSLAQPNGANQILIDNIQHLPFGPIKAFQYGNALSLTRTFDQNYRMESQHITGILESQYGYDPAGNITSWLDLIQTSRDQSFGYDELDRLTDAIGAYGDLDYSYDAIGNRLSITEDGVSESYSYAQGSHRLEEILGTTTDTRQYDEAGNTIDSLLGSYTYDDQNRMVGFSKTGTAASYGYNGKGERVRKTVNGTITRFRYGPSGVLLGEYDQSGLAIREYVYLEGQPVAQLQGSAPVQVAYLHADHLGAVVKATDGAGSVVWDSDRRPFGERAETVAVVEMPLGFPGQYFDEESGNYYNYFRDYDPTTGRYLQSDPIGLDGGINTYGYVGGNPLSYFDPLGLYQMCHRDLLLPIPYARHCYMKFDDGTTSSYDPSGVNPDPDPNQQGTECTTPKEPEKDDCIKKAMQKCKGPNYSFTGFNCCHCAEQAMKECNTSIPPDDWPNFPINPGPQQGEPGYSPLPVYDSTLGQ